MVPPASSSSTARERRGRGNGSKRTPVSRRRATRGAGAGASSGGRPAGGRGKAQTTVGAPGKGTLGQVPGWVCEEPFRDVAEGLAGHRELPSHLEIPGEWCEVNCNGFLGMSMGGPSCVLPLFQDMREGRIVLLRPAPFASAADTLLQSGRRISNLSR
jgi:hypothetical protein